MVMVADSAMVGQLGPVPLAAASLTNSCFFIVLAFGVGLSFGITPLVASADGEGDIPRIKKILFAGLSVNMVFALAIFALVYFGSFFLSYLNQPDEVTLLAGPYLRVVNLSGIFLMIFQTFRQFAEGLSDTRTAMNISLIANGLNIFLNYIMIFGHFGFEPMGLLGAGYATLISRIFMAISMGLYLYWKKNYRHYFHGVPLRDIRWITCMRIMKVGVPSGLQFFFEVGAFAIAAVMVGWISAEALAAHQVALSLAAITYMIASGLAAAATIRIGNQMGLKDAKTLKEIGISTLVLSVIFMGLAGLVFILFNDYLPQFFIDNLEVVHIAAGLLLIAAAFQLGDGVQVVSLGVLRGMEDTRIPTWLTLIAYWGTALPLAYLCGFVFNLGVYGVWIGLCLGLIMAAVLLSIRFFKMTKKLLENPEFEK